MIKTIGIIGAGSVGSGLINEMYARDPDNIYILAKGERAERIKSTGISVNGKTFNPTVYSDPAQDIHIDCLLIAVKTYSLDAVMEDIADLIDKDTILLPIENGINATSRIKERFPENRVFYGVVLRTDAHRMGHRVYYNTLGELQLGYADNHVVQPEVQETFEKLTELGINARIYEDMLRTQWLKWMLNTGGSQAAVEVEAECGFFGMVSEVRDLMSMLMDEIVTVGRAEGVNITEKDRDDIIELLINYPPDKKMSMLQDYEAGRSIEIDEYAGTVVRLGEKHGIPTPANRILYLTITARQKISDIRRGAR